MADGARLRVLVTGANGQLGQDLVPLFEPHDVRAAARADLDVGERSTVLANITTFRPDIVVNCAAWTAVDACEDDPDRAFRDNAMAVRHLADGCRRVGAHFVTVSTDYVFDGTKPTPYREWDDTNPQSVYGASKLAGEREAGPDATVVRTSWVCGFGGGNMVKTILRLLGEHPTLSFVSDQVGHPTFTADLATIVHRLAIERMPGVFHATNAGAVSWYEFAQAVAAAAGEDPSRVEPIATADLQPPRPAPRPANSVLDNQALRLSGIDPLGHFERPLVELVRQLRS